jgi:hypothetical protein
MVVSEVFSHFVKCSDFPVLIDEHVSLASYQDGGIAQCMGFGIREDMMVLPYCLRRVVNIASSRHTRPLVQRIRVHVAESGWSPPQNKYIYSRVLNMGVSKIRRVT